MRSYAQVLWMPFTCVFAACTRARNGCALASAGCTCGRNQKQGLLAFGRPTIRVKLHLSTQHGQELLTLPQEEAWNACSRLLGVRFVEYDVQQSGPNAPGCVHWGLPGLFWAGVVQELEGSPAGRSYCAIWYPII